MNDVEIKENCVVQFIDKNEIIETMQDCKYANPCNDFQMGVNACIDIQIVGIKRMPAADVVPKSEVDKLHEVNADLNESLRLAAEANKDLQVEFAAMRSAANSFKMHYESARAEVAMEIFEEIEKMLKDQEVVAKNPREKELGDWIFHNYLPIKIAKLKKKHMKGKA